MSFKGFPKVGEALKRVYEDGARGPIRHSASDPQQKRGSTAGPKSDPDTNTPSAPFRRTGTELVPYQDVEQFGFKDLRSRGRRAPTLFYWPARLIRNALLLIAFIAFAGGLYDQVSWGAHKMFGTTVEGEVIKLDARSAGLATPTVAYALPLDGGEWQAVSRLPRNDVALGDKIAVSVIPGSEGLTRIERSDFWRTVSIAALVGGAAAMWTLMSVWRILELAFGWRRQQENATSAHTRTFASLMIAIVLVGAAWMKFVYTPWLGVSEFAYLVTAPDKAMRAAGERCGSVGSGPLNACELRMLDLPKIGHSASEGAYRAALIESDFVSLARYHSAIANPEINFAFDWRTAAPLLLNTDPEVLVSLLATGVAPPMDIAADLLAGAEARGWAQVSAALRRASQAGG